MPVVSSTARADRTMREWSAGSGFQKAISVMRYASAMIRSAKPKAWNVSTLRAWMPSAWPMASRPPRRSTIRVVMPGNWDSCAAVSMPAGPEPTMSTSTSSGSSAGRLMPTPAAGWIRGSPDT